MDGGRPRAVTSSPPLRIKGDPNAFGLLKTWTL
jgi:hypothetical protein